MPYYKGIKGEQRPGSGRKNPYLYWTISFPVLNKSILNDFDLVNEKHYIRLGFVTETRPENLERRRDISFLVSMIQFPVLKIQF